MLGRGVEVAAGVRVAVGAGVAVGNGANVGTSVAVGAGVEVAPSHAITRSINTDITTSPIRTLTPLGKARSSIS